MAKETKKSEDAKMVVDRPKKVSEMSIYSKLLHCRAELRKMDIKKSGYNTYSNFTYYELKDFIGPIMDLCLTYNLFTEVTFDLDVAKLTVTNIDNTDEKIVFTSPMSSAKLTACHEIQNLGAVETYERRYLYMTAFEIVEPDILDGTSGKEKNTLQGKSSGAARKISDKQVKVLFAKGYAKGYDFEKVKKQVKKTYNLDRVEDMTVEQFENLCEKYDSLPDEPQIC